MSKQELPLVSIIIPVYNGSKYLEDAILSAINQTYTNIEILVINDGSNDNGATAAIAHRFSSKISYFEKVNGGVSSALNFGISKMNGEYMSWLSHDDLYYPFKIEKQVNFIKSTGFFGMIHSNYDYINNVGERLARENDFHKFTNIDIINRLFLCYPIGGITCLIPKKIIDDIGLFDTKLRTCQDYDYWLRVAMKYNIIDLDFIGASSRIHSLQGTNTIKSMRDECDVFYKGYFQKMVIDGQFKKELLNEVNSFFLKNYYFKSSIWLFRQYNPSINIYFYFTKQALKFIIKSTLIQV